MANSDTVVKIQQAGEQFKVRFPDGLHTRLKAEAAQHRRSVNAEVVARLEASFASGGASLSGEIATLIQKHVDAEVQRRLREIAAQIGGAA